MTSQLPDSDSLFSGGLAETVSRPTPLTYSFLSYWFCGERSVGKAMELLELPYVKTEKPIVVMADSELCVDLAVEELTLYSNTIFYYKKQNERNSLPSLGINFARLFSPAYLNNTLKILLYQSRLIANPTQSTEKAKLFISQMPQDTAGKQLKEVDAVLSNTIWPRVIAIGALGEFYSKLIEHEVHNPHDLKEILTYIGNQVAPNDWFFTSLSHQAKVRSGSMTFEEYLDHYRFRSQKDYELACPRWYEEQDQLYSQIMSGHFDRPDTKPAKLNVSQKTESYIQAIIQLQILRSEARRIALVWMDALRQNIIQLVGTDIEHYSRDELLNGLRNKVKIYSATSLPSQPVRLDHAREGKGMPVSPGTISGKARHISSAIDRVDKGTIGIFPNASTDFTMVYPQCAGIIFLVGGQTSHGAIVAREFGIPAIVEGSARDVPESTEISLNGAQGSWKST